MRALLSIAALGLVASCGSSDPVDAAGNYTVAITSRENGCGFDNWTEGNTASGIAVTMTQEGAEAQATVSGVAAVILDVLQGGHVFSGQVDGSHLVLEIFGTNQLNRDGCPHVVNSVFDADLDGDFLAGELRYTVNGNGSPECQALEGCISRQELNGTRPPQ